MVQNLESVIKFELASFLLELVLSHTELKEMK